MRVDQIIRGVYTPGQAINYTIGKGHLNGLLLMSTSASLDANITVRRRGRSDTKVLAANLRLAELFRISDLEYGYNPNYGRLMEILYSDLKAAGVTGFTTDSKLETLWEPFVGEMGVFLYYLDLGSIYLGDDSELVFNMQVGANMTAGNFGLWSVSVRRTPDFMFQYDRVVDFDATHRDVDTIYIANTGTKPSIFEVSDSTKLISYEAASTVQIEDHNGPYLSDLYGMFAATSLFAETEGFLDQRVFMLYKRPDALPAKVYVKVNNLPTAGGEDWALIVRRFVADDRYVSANTINEGTLYATRLAALERENPALAQALRHRGDTPKAITVAAQVVQAQNAAGQ